MDAYVAYLETIFRTVRACSAATGSFVRVMIVVDAAQLSLSTLRHVGIIKSVARIGARLERMLMPRRAILDKPRGTMSRAPDCRRPSACYLAQVQPTIRRAARACSL